MCDIIRSLLHAVRVNSIKHPERDVQDITISVSLLLVKVVTCTDMREDNNLDEFKVNVQYVSQTPPKVLSTDYTTPGERIRACRQSKGWLIKTLAKKSGLSITGISYIENGKSNPDLKTLKKLAEVLDVPVSHLSCYEMLPENTLMEKLEKARLYHGHTKKEMAHELGVSIKSIFAWQTGRQPGEKSMEKIKSYSDILR